MGHNWPSKKSRYRGRHLMDSVFYTVRLRAAMVTQWGPLKKKMKPSLGKKSPPGMIRTITDIYVGHWLEKRSNISGLSQNSQQKRMQLPATTETSMSTPLVPLLDHGARAGLTSSQKDNALSIALLQGKQLRTTAEEWASWMPIRKPGFDHLMLPQTPHWVHTPRRSLGYSWFIFELLRLMLGKGSATDPLPGP